MMKPLNYNNPMRKVQTRREGSRVNDATVGPHAKSSSTRVKNTAAERHERKVASQAAKRNRAIQKGAYGEAKYVKPRLESGETQQQHKRRMGSKNNAQSMKATNNFKRIALIVGAIAILVAVGVGATSCAFTYFVSNNLAFSDERIEEMLTSTKDDVSYLLFSADLDSLDGNTDGIDTMLLVRLDKAEKNISVLQIPGNLEVRFTDNQIHLANEASAEGGDAEVIYGMKLYFDIDIAHYARISEQGIKNLVDAMGGIEMSIAHEVDDPAAGSLYIPEGTQTLNGEQALVYLRCINYSEGLAVRAMNQASFGALLGQRLLSANDGEINSFLDAITHEAHTDMNASEIKSLVSTFKDIQPGSIKYGYLPGYELSHNGATSFIAYETSFELVWDLFTSGETPVLPDDDAEIIERSAVEVSVRNGSGVDSGASKIATILDNAGFHIVSTGNAESYVYTETLVIYHDEKYAGSAKAMVQELGCGRALLDVGFYAFDSHVLVVLGSDWHPDIFS